MDAESVVVSMLDEPSFLRDCNTIENVLQRVGIKDFYDFSLVRQDKEFMVDVLKILDEEKFHKNRHLFHPHNGKAKYVITHKHKVSGDKYAWLVKFYLFVGPTLRARHNERVAQNPNENIEFTDASKGIDDVICPYDGPYTWS